ncbi:hypothetical protein D3C87_1812880 [compost metagenome]
MNTLLLKESRIAQQKRLEFVFPLSSFTFAIAMHMEFRDAVEPLRGFRDVITRLFMVRVCFHDARLLTLRHVLRMLARSHVVNDSGILEVIGVCVRWPLFDE